MKRYALTLLLLAAPCLSGLAQVSTSEVIVTTVASVDTNPTVPGVHLGTVVADAQPVSTGLKLVLAAPTMLIPNASVGGLVAEIVNRGVSYIATNGVVSIGAGNTLDKLSKADFTEVINVKAELPIHIPTNSIAELHFMGVNSTCFSDKNHVGLGLGAEIVWHVAWLQNTGLLFFKTLADIHIGASIAPDIDQTIALRFARRTTVADVSAGFKATF